MKNTLYFNSNAGDPLELAQLNEGFYHQFIAEYGSSKMHSELWTGETLYSLIKGMKKQCQTLSDRAERKRAAKLIQQYKALYKTFVKQ